MVRRGSYGAAWLTWCGVAQLWCGVAQSWCGVAQLVARRPAVRQARVRFSARHHREVFPTELSSDEEMERDPSKWRRIYVLNECMNVCYKNMSNKQKEWHRATKPKKKKNKPFSAQTLYITWRQICKNKSWSWLEMPRKVRTGAVAASTPISLALVSPILFFDLRTRTWNRKDSIHDAPTSFHGCWIRIRIQEDKHDLLK